MTAHSQFTFGALVINTGEANVLFEIAHQLDADARHTVSAPTFQVNGVPRGDFVFDRQIAERELRHTGREAVLRYIDSGTPALQLLVTLRWHPNSPIIRWQYQLSADTPAALTKQDGRDELCYITVRSTRLRSQQLTDIQLSHFDPIAHTYQPVLEHYSAPDCYDGQQFAGPIAAFHDAAHTLLLAYEHGADHPDSFLRFSITETQHERTLTLRAHKGNYYGNQPLGPTTIWESVWLEIAVAPLPFDAFLPRYRQFVLDELCEQRESRQPYLFYNTWNYQERNRYFNGRPYLESMNQARILEEVDIAHQLGIEVFVIDTGWYQKTGDWQVDKGRFPNELRDVKQRLDSYGMRLGLWFNPTVAALTSEMYTQHPEWEMTRSDRPVFRHMVWETEESTSMCLCSAYADAFIATLLRLREELGVTYFKWDAVQQYGCDSPLHDHGTAQNSATERSDSYAFQMGRQMIRIVAEVTQRYPEVIVDFDITERGRFVGLGFLAVGKYFLINNGPYFSDFDIPRTVAIQPNTINVFFYPGTAHPRVCRRGAAYDPIIPSILFLTHFLPDGPAQAQRNSLASLMLGGNGIWGDLLALDTEEIDLIHGQLAAYKQVASAVTESYPRVRGFIGASPEIHEKIEPHQASGLIVFFSVIAGSVTHVTQPINLTAFGTVTGADSWEVLADGRLKISVQLEQNDARAVCIKGRQ